MDPRLDRALAMNSGANFEAEWRRRFSERGRRFDDDAAIAGWSDAGLQARLRNFRRIWPGADPATRWVDVGCGAGSYSRDLRACGSVVIGIDYSLPSVRKARERVPGVTWLVADARALPLRDGAVHGALCFGVMQALSDPEPALRELLRVTAPGGEIWVDALNVRFPPTWLKCLRARLTGASLPLRHDRPAQLAASLRQLGAEDIRLHWVPILPAGWWRLQALLESAPARRILAWLPPLALLLSHAFVLSARRGLERA